MNIIIHVAFNNLITHVASDAKNSHNNNLMLLHQSNNLAL